MNQKFFCEFYFTPNYFYNIVMFDTELYSEHISNNALSCDDRNYDLNKPRIKDIL